MMNLPTILRHLQIPSLLASRGVFEVSKFTYPILSEGSRRWKTDDRRILLKSMPIKDMGTQGEKQLDVDLINVSTKVNPFPDGDTAETVFNGVKFRDLPICHIKASKNNTIMQVTDATGKHIVYNSCGLEGFKNTRKGTNIAAQTAAITIGGKAKSKGVHSVRILVQGLGPGRMSAVKGLQMAGLKIVSVTDNTPISFTPPRPRKARRL